MKKRLIALLLVLMLLIPAGIASAATYYRVNTSSLQVRMQPSTSAKVLATYKRDAVCTVSKTENGWSYVYFVNGTEGWVKASYLKKASSYTAWVAGDNTSLRPKPDGNSGSNATLAKGTKVTVLSHGSNYDYVKTASFGYGDILVECLHLRERVEIRVQRHVELRRRDLQQHVRIVPELAALREAAQVAELLGDRVQPRGIVL